MGDIIHSSDILHTTRPGGIQFIFPLKVFITFIVISKENILQASHQKMPYLLHARSFRLNIDRAAADHSLLLK